MQRPTSQLGHHLLTRSDLAALAVRATEVFRWLAEGAIEQVGDLPRATNEPDPVFAVNSDQLRTELVARLAGIGKSPVVLTPIGVRSFLLRALLLGKGAEERAGAAGAARELVAALDAELPVPRDGEATAAGRGVDASVAEHLLTTDLAAVLQDALLEVAPDVEAMLQLAAEIAAAESAAPSNAPWAGPDDDDAAESPEEAIPSSTEDDEEPEFEFDHGDFEADGDDDDFDACFDLDELSKLDATAPASPQEKVMAEPFDAPHQAPDESRPEPAIAEAPTASPQAFEELFSPDAEQEVAAVGGALADDEQSDDARTVEQAVEDAIGAVVEAFEETEASGDAADSAVVGDADVQPTAEPQPEPECESVTTADACTQLDPAKAVADAGAEVADSDDPLEAPTVATEIIGESVVDEVPAASSSMAAATLVNIDDDAREPVLAAEEAETVNEAETDVDGAIEMQADQDAVTGSELLQDPTSAQLEHAVTEHEPEAAASMAPVMAEPAAAEPVALADFADPAVIEESTAQAVVADEPAGEEPLAEEPTAELQSMTHTDEGSLTVEPPGDGPAFDEALVDAVTEAVEAHVANATEPVGDEFALTSQAMDKVQDFLGELRSALVEMAQRPQQQASTPSIDVAPLIEAVQAGFDRSAEQAGQASSALASLAERVGQFGQQVESSVQQSVKALAEQQQLLLQEAQGKAPVAVADRPRFLVQRPGRQALVLGAVAILVLCWSILFWFKTGSPRLAFGTLIGANLVGCCLLVARRD